MFVSSGKRFLEVLFLQTQSRKFVDKCCILPVTFLLPFEIRNEILHGNKSLSWGSWRNARLWASVRELRWNASWHIGNRDFSLVLFMLSFKSPACVWPLLSNHLQSSESLGFWNLPIVRNSKQTESTFRKMNLFPTSGEWRRHLHFWIHYTELTSISGFLRDPRL
jgi:hypothetical protein